MPADGCFGENLVGGVGFFEESLGGFEAVDEEGRAAFAFGVREEVEHLEAGRIGEVGCVGVGWEGEVGVGCVFHCEVGCEVVETT